MSEVLKQAQQQIVQDLTLALGAFSLPEPLKAAVHHAVMLGGKRVRPALCYATAQLQQPTLSPAVRRAAVAVELIHCYSLVHDDLPCMDNDLLRRGQPTCHVAYGEANALLAGDILQSMAMEVLASRLFEDGQYSSDASIVLKQIQILATASSKMVCGQTLDLQAEGQQVSQQHLEQIHRNKTGALITAAIMMSAVCFYDGTHTHLAKLRQFGQLLGLAFQVQDDILDITANSQTLGKTAGKDAQVEKSTYPALMGLAQAQAYAQQLHDEAWQILDTLGEEAAALKDLTAFLLQRKH
ncbi:MAG: polyprenyl synthetase family protein [Acinetobacter sp.]|nr:polyprenyl synthetase family protein [Acinetobacter sp.]